MKLLVRALALSTPLFALAGCPSSGGGDTKVSEADAPEVISQQACQLYFDCTCEDLLMPSAFTSQEACESELEGILIGAVDQGQMNDLVYDPDCVGEVFDLYDQLGCVTVDALSADDISALTGLADCKVYHGDREVGQSCELDLDIGDDCVQGAVCADGTCEAVGSNDLPDPGEPCENLFTPCNDGTLCLDVDGDGPEQAVCGTLPGNGETCFGAADLCDEGFACDQADKTCQPAPGEGEDCAEVILDQCAAGLICNMGTCVAEPTLGEPCINLQCADGFVCENNQCQEATPLSCSYAPGILD